MTTMTKRILTVLAIVGAVALAGVAMWLARRRPTPILPKEQTTIDSLHATQPAFDSIFKGTTGGLTNVVTKIVHDTAAVRQLRTAADRERARADSLAAAAARSADSATIWHQAYDARTSEATALRTAVDTLTRDLNAATDHIHRAQIQLAADSSRIAAQVDLTDRLASDLRHASPPCRVAYLFSCPSRKVVAVTTAAATYLVTRKDVRDKVTSAIKGAIP